MSDNLDELIQLVRAVLTPDLLPATFAGPPHPMAGHCYTACQALYHLSPHPLELYRMRPYSLTNHFFLRHRETEAVIDPTWDQFGFPINYDEGIPFAFHAKKPNKAARIVIDRVRSQASVRKW